MKSDDVPYLSPLASPPSHLDMANDPQIHQLNIQKQPFLTPESANLPEPQNAVTVLESTDSSASLPVERKKKFKLPRIALQDKKRPEFAVKSCIEIDQTIPEDDAELHEGDAQCCPPCDPQDGKVRASPYPR